MLKQSFILDCLSYAIAYIASLLLLTVEVTPVAKDWARQKLRQTCNWSDDTAVAVFFGFLHPVKGIETLLLAFKQVVSVQPQARLLLIGGVACIIHERWQG